jgi:hypothetical protein
MDHNSDLLRPSLSADHNPSAAIYSLRTEFLTSFFGGPIAGAAIALLNSYRLKRLSVDWPIGLIAIAFSTLLAWLATHGGWHWLDAALGRGSGSIGARVINLVFFTIVYAFHRTYFKSMSVLGIAAPNGLAVGIGAIILGLLANVGLIKVFLQ